MKYAASLVLLAACSFVGSAMAQTAAFPPRSSANTVFVGHSLINYDMPRMVQAMAASRSGMRLTSAVQVINGAPLSFSWERCRRANWSGQWPPREFACDEIEAGSVSGLYDSLIATDANNSIESNRIWNRTHEQLERFMDLLLSRNPQGRTFMYTSWESWDFHNGRWLEAIDSELAQYETIARQAEQISASRGRNGRVEVLPVNLALRNLVRAIQRGEVPGVINRQQIFDDGVHMTQLGNYFVASVVFAALFNQSADGVTNAIPGEYGGTLVQVPPATATAFHRIAWQTISSYRGGASGVATRPGAPQSLRVQ
jgi:hypothetical protein